MHWNLSTAFPNIRDTVPMLHPPYAPASARPDSRCRDSDRYNCQNHIDNNDVPFRCNPVKFRKATAYTECCPVHLGKVNLPADQRLQQFPEQNSWQKHISRYILQYIKTYDPTFLPYPHLRYPITYHSEQDL